MKTLDTLQKLGLSSYEAKAYTALVAVGLTSASKTSGRIICRAIDAFDAYIATALPKSSTLSSAVAAAHSANLWSCHP